MLPLRLYERVKGNMAQKTKSKIQSQLENFLQNRIMSEGILQIWWNVNHKHLQNEGQAFRKIGQLCPRFMHELQFFSCQSPCSIQYSNHHNTNISEDRNHILAIPRAPRIRHMALTANANVIFSYTIRIVFLEIFIARAILAGSSSIRTMSAASMAASEPMGAHGGSDICPGKYRGIVDSVTYEGKFFFCRLLGEKFLNLIDLVPRKKFTMYFIQPKLGCYVISYFFGVAYEHDSFSYAGFFSPRMASAACSLITSEIRI